MTEYQKEWILEKSRIANKNCKKCKELLNYRNKSGYCKKHINFFKTIRYCKDCEEKLFSHTKRFCRECSLKRISKRRSAWQKNNPEKHAKANGDYAKRHPDRINARAMANRKLRHLRPKGYEFHHRDYSQPLLVEILPIKKHKIVHGGNIKLQINL